MGPSMADAMYERVAQDLAPGSRLLRAWELKGGVSAQVAVLEIERPDGGTEKLVLRRHGEVDLSRNPNIAADEFRLLELVRSAGLPAPAPRYLDWSGRIFGTPFLAIEYIDGESEFAPADVAGYVRQMAELLARIHSVDCSTLDLAFLPRQEEWYAGKLADRPATLDESLGEGRIRGALEAAWPLPRLNEPALLHGDFWPGNLLWREGELAAIIDWEDAATGDPLADLANSRLEILWAFGVDAMGEFTRIYRARMTALDFTHLPYWDLCAALRPASKLSGWGLDAGTERLMRERHGWFVAQAFEELDR